jgi:hypothetical protein
VALFFCILRGMLLPREHHLQSRTKAQSGRDLSLTWPRLRAGAKQLPGTDGWFMSDLCLTLRPLPSKNGLTTEIPWKSSSAIIQNLTSFKRWAMKACMCRAWVMKVMIAKALSITSPSRLPPCSSDLSGCPEKASAKSSASCKRSTATGRPGKSEFLAGRQSFFQAGFRNVRTVFHYGHRPSPFRDDHRTPLPHRDSLFSHRPATSRGF